MSFPPPTPKQARVMWFSLTALALAALAAVLGMVLWGLGWLMHRLACVPVPMIFALILAYILEPVVDFFVKKKVSRLWSVCLVFTLATLVLLAAISSVLPDLRRESRKLAEDLPKNLTALGAKFDHFMATSPFARALPQDWFPSRQATPPASTNEAPNSPAPPSTAETQPLAPNGQSPTATGEPISGTVIPDVEKLLVTIVKWFTTQLSQVTTWAEFLIGFVLVPVYLFYFLLEKNAITTRWPDYLPLKQSAAKEETVFILQAVSDCMIVFFRGQVLVALCVGALLAAGYLLLGLNYAILLGLVAGVLGIVPYLGTITSLVLALIVAGFQFGDWLHPVLVLAIAGVVKLLEDFIISPRIIGERAGLHPLTIILAVLIGTTLVGGFMGAMLAIPLTAAMRTLMFRYIWTREHPGTKFSESKQFTQTDS